MKYEQIYMISKVGEWTEGQTNRSFINFEKCKEKNPFNRLLQISVDCKITFRGWAEKGQKN